MPENAKLGMRYEWRTQQPGGASVIGDFWLAPGRTGSPDHINPLFTEHVTVRSGVAEFRCGDKRWNEDAGAHVELPAGVPHNFRNVGDTELHVEVEIRPPGEYPAFLDAMFERGGPTTKNGTPLNPLRAAVIADRYRDAIYLTNSPIWLQRRLTLVFAWIGRRFGYRP
jgi:quercetin dioxygenase-like cupin family protein